MRRRISGHGGWIEGLENRRFLSAVSSAAAITVGPIVDATPLRYSQVAPQIAVNPLNSQDLVMVAQNVENQAAIPVEYSFNGGQSWTRNYITGNTDGLPANNPRVDPRVAFDSYGNVYVAYEVAASYTEIRIVVARSSNDAVTFSAVSTAVGGAGCNADYPNIATGPAAANSRKQAIWISYTDYADPNAIRVKAVYATSSGLGQLSSFSSPQGVGAAGGDVANLAVGSSGQVAIAYETQQNPTGPDNIMISVNAKGTNGGGFNRNYLASTTNVGPYDPIPAEPNRTIDAVPQVAFDRSGDSTDGRLYLVYTDAVAPGSADTNIELRYSDNLGASFSPALRVNDDTTSNSQFLPALAVDQTTGNVGISWLDARNSPANNTVQEYAAISTTHAASVQPNFMVSSGTSNQAGANTDGQSWDYGDVTGACFANNRFIVAWADNSNVLGQNPDGTDSFFDVYTAIIIV